MRARHLRPTLKLSSSNARKFFRGQLSAERLHHQ